MNGDECGINRTILIFFRLTLMEQMIAMVIVKITEYVVFITHHRVFVLVSGAVSSVKNHPFV